MPTVATVTVSSREPMSSRILSPAVMLAVEDTFRLVAPAGASATTQSCEPAVPTAVTVATSIVRP